MEDEILKLLEKGDISKIENNIQTFVSPVLSGSEKVERKAYNISVGTARILMKVIAHAEKASEQQLKVLEKGADLCYQCLVLKPIQWKGAMDLHRYLLKLIFEFQRQNYSDGALRLTETFLSHLLAHPPVNSADVDTLSKSTTPVYRLLYNASGRAAGESTTLHQLRQRVRAVHVCVYGAADEDAFNTAFSKLEIALVVTKQDVVIHKLSDKDVAKICDFVIKSLTDIAILTESFQDDANARHSQLRAVWKFFYLTSLKYADFLIFAGKRKQARDLVAECSKRVMQCKSIPWLEDEKLAKLCREILNVFLKALEALLVKEPEQKPSDKSDLIGNELEACIKASGDVLKDIKDMGQKPDMSTQSSDTLKSCGVVLRTILLTVNSWPGDLVRVGRFDYVGSSNQSRLVRVHEYLLLCVKGELNEAVKQLQAAKEDQSLRTFKEKVKQCQDLQEEYVYKHMEMVDIQLALLSKPNLSSSETVQKECEAACSHLVDFLASCRKLKDTAISTELHLHFGLQLYKLGRQLFTKPDYEGSVRFHELSCAQLEIWAKTASKEDIQKKAVWRRWEGLVQSLRHAGRFAEALRAICRGLIQDPTHLLQARDLWVGVKVEAAKAKGAEDLQIRVLWRELSNVCKVEKLALPAEISAHAALETELKSTLRNKYVKNVKVSPGMSKTASQSHSE